MFRFRLGTSLFLLRRHNILLGILITAVVLLTVYFLFTCMPSNASSSENSALKAEIQKGDLSILETRLEKLEKELQRNRVVLTQLKDTVKSWINVEPEYGNEITDTGYHAGFRSFVKMISTEYQFCSKPMAHSTENTLDIYEKIDFDNKDGGVWKQGWNLAYDENQWNDKQKLRIFVVPHSHNDPGWIKTFDKYYTDQTQHILNNMVLKMKEDKRRKFIWAEVSFFAQWWEKIDKKTQAAVKKLIADGQLEIVTGGWVMNDEATAHYYAMVEQMVEGHQWLQQNLDYKPKNGWAIDPFGLSPTMAYLLRRMGIDNMVIQRVHYSIKKYLAKHKSLEFLWRQLWDQNHTMDILCHTMPFYSYDIPHTCGPDPKICCQFDFKRLPGNKVNCPWRIPPVAITEKNVADRAWILLDQYRKKSQLFQSNVVMIQLGDDFRYDKVNEWDQQFNNYQKLFDYINSREDWHAEAQFGTLDDYFSALREEMNVDERNMSASFPSLTGDFFTYADRDDHYWSGYFTSRPFYKNMDRSLEAHLRCAEILFSIMMAKIDEQIIQSMHSYVTSLMGDIVSSRRTLSLFQHHDAITGTSRDHVVLDYASKMSVAFQKLRYVIGQCAVFLLAANTYDAIDEEISLLQTDEYRHHNSLPIKKTISFSSEIKVREIVLFNSLGFSRKELIKVIISSASVLVKDNIGNDVPSQVNPIFVKDKLVTAEYELVFAAELPALTLTTYFIHELEPGESTSNKCNVKLIRHASLPSSFSFPLTRVDETEEFSIKSDFMTAVFSGSTGMLKKIRYMAVASEWNDMDIEIKFLKYGTKTKGKDKSGAYLFLPDSDAKEIDYGKPTIRILEGHLYSEVTVLLHDIEHHIILKNSPGVDGIGFHVYNIVNIASEFNKELVMRFITNLSNSNEEFYTDLNGFQMLKRRYFHKLPIQANVYPVTTMAFMEDETKRFTFLTGHSVGATCLQPGERMFWGTGVFDVFLDRRLNQDDNRGLQQGVTDNKDTPTSFRIFIEHHKSHLKGSSAYPSLLAHHASLSHLHPVFILIRLSPETDPNFVIRNPSIQLKSVYTPMQSDMPCDIHILNLRTLSLPFGGSNFVPSKSSVLNLHRMGFDCNFEMIGNCSYHNGTISIYTLFPGLFGKDVEEASLSLLYTGKKFPREAFIQLPAMEIVTLKLSQS